MPTIAKANEAAIYYNISLPSLRKWAREGTIPVQRTPGGQYRYILPSKQDDPEQLPNDGDWSSNIIYARVSSRKQYDDLQRQSNYLKQRYPNYSIVTDIGSGINFERKGFKTILERLFQGHVTKVVVAHQDRFVRFGFDFFQWIFTKFNAVLETVDKPSVSNGEDLVADIMEIFTVFTARFYGRRKYSNTDDVIKETKGLSKSKPKKTI